MRCVHEKQTKNAIVMSKTPTTKTSEAKKPKPTKAELIEAVCMAVLKKEKANPKHAEIVINRSEVLVKIKKKVLGHVVETNGTFNFQYLIS